MINLLIKIFIKDHENIKEPHVRDSYGKLAGVVGILSNLLLCTFKIIVGLLSRSIAILADGVNNLSDAASSIILLVGLKLASKPADENHPYGHARIEYITGLLISFFIIILGIQLLISSVNKIRNPEPTQFNYFTVIVLVAAIGIKIWQSFFYFKISKIIDSTTIKATGIDSRNDGITTTVVLLSIIIGEFADLQLDGYMGALVALFIIYSGIKLILETSTPLLGEAPDPKLVSEIQNRILANDDVIGIHDLVVHSYGPRRTFASVHIEVDAYGDLIAIHDMIDNIERAIFQDLKIELVAHMDPLDTKDPLTVELNEKLEEIIKPIEGILSFHDLRVVIGYTHHNIIFDVVVNHQCKMRDSELKTLLEKKIQELSPNYYAVITIDKSYIIE